MGFNKREATSDLTVLGNDEGQVGKAGGLLASMRQDNRYPSRHNYELVQRSGESIWLAGSASLGNQLGPEDVGRFIRCTFKGWGSSSNGKFKIIEVMVSDDDLPDELLEWPRYKEIQKRIRNNGGPQGTPPLDETQAAVHDDEDDLPF
jgi:hypothetical protein